MKAKSYFLGLVALSLLIFACKPKNPSWDAEILMPLVTSEVSMDNILKDSLLEADDDSVLSLVYRSSIFNLSITEELISIPDTFFRKNLALDSLSLNDRTVVDFITLGEIAAGSGPLGQLIINNHGGSFPIPGLSTTGGAPIDVDATSFF